MWCSCWYMGAQGWVVSGVSLTDTPRYPLPLLFLRLFSQIRASFLLLYWSISCCQHGPGSPCSAFPGDVPCVWSPLLKLRVHSALETAQLTASHHHSVPLTSSICLQQKCMSSCSCPSWRLHPHAAHQGAAPGCWASLDSPCPSCWLNKPSTHFLRRGGKKANKNYLLIVTKGYFFFFALPCGLLLC